MVLPVEPCDGERVWSCTTCGEQMEVQTVVDLVTAASDRLGKHEEVSSLRILRHLNQCFNSMLMRYHIGEFSNLKRELSTFLPLLMI
jgi:hypothetical protein